MKKCPACAEEIQDQALKCRFCGEILVDRHWRAFCEGFARLTQEEKTKEYAKLSDEQRSAFEAAWQLLGSSLGEQSGGWRPQPIDRSGADSRKKAGKRSSPLVVGCLALLALFVLLFIVASFNRNAARTQTATQPAPEKPARQVEGLYHLAKSALDQGNYSRAEELLRKVRQQQPGYRDIEELLALPEVKKVTDERVRKRRYQLLPSVFPKRQANIRSGPGTENRIVRQAQPGERLRYEEKEGEWYKLQSEGGDTEWVHESVVMTQAEQQIHASADLQLLSWNWSTQYSFATAEGRVKNVSGRSLENVEAVIEWHTSSGSFITSADCLIEYNPILPSQTSPFRCSTRANPAMQTARIDFKTLFGGSLEWFKE